MWTTPDPYMGSYNWNNPQSLNRYGYVGGSPFGAVDPSGLDASGWFYAGTVTNADLYGSTIGSWLNSWVAPVVPFLDAADLVYNVAGLFDDLFQSFGWLGSSSPFHGSVAASQSGKNVPSVAGAANMLAFFQAAEPDIEPVGEGGNEPESWEGPPETWPLAPVESGEFVEPESFNTYSENPGPLSRDIAENFMGGRYNMMRLGSGLSSDRALYRTYGPQEDWRGSPNSGGTYFSLEPAAGPLQNMLDNAVAPEWGNTGENSVCLYLPPGTVVAVGLSAPRMDLAGWNFGGQLQVFVPGLTR
jgi:hypothetical protein